MTKYMLIIFMTLALPGTVIGQVVSKDELRYNGDNWLRYGPAVISSCRSVRISLRLGGNNKERHTVFISDPVRVEKINKWLIARLESKLNYSPIVPISVTIAMPNNIILYSSEEERDDDRLITIPLNQRTLGCTGDECKKMLKDTIAIKELKELMSNK